MLFRRAETQGGSRSLGRLPLLIPQEFPRSLDLRGLIPYSDGTTPFMARSKLASVSALCGSPS
jgi:hypothetical protein